MTIPNFEKLKMELTWTLAFSKKPRLMMKMVRLTKQTGLLPPEGKWREVDSLAIRGCVPESRPMTEEHCSLAHWRAGQWMGQTRRKPMTIQRKYGQSSLELLENRKSWQAANFLASLHCWAHTCVLTFLESLADVQLSSLCAGQTRVSRTRRRMKRIVCGEGFQQSHAYLSKWESQCRLPASICGTG